MTWRGSPATTVDPRIRDTIGAITCCMDTAIMARLPKTRSGKTLRKTLSNIVNGKEYRVPSTIDDPGVITESDEVLPSKMMVKEDSGNRSELPDTSQM